ncbi:MAG: penicillin-binding transpeptidase domain-containing protein [Gammaproteobacteria bacterium]|nr:penicillin-binding transpeptidase domain-containing protein [Gammaproteobacteria bacterium]MDH4315169.1 penicillin-binding transpeptidase domain-containing protein [Gammaproteobacteria bacterium]MDH5213622.1 penicillin-binding transpeptidase domain-containing protein [Gammaproteobacteria bacterium]MDH5500684.1 penicillin-binding transpeptidase domain-containing protein [Gammaproteobacteria bacterium]
MTRGAETKEQSARRFVVRVMLVMVFFVLAASSLMARAVHLQVLNKDFLNQQADSRHLRTEKISAHRGSIVDRNGEPLAISTPVDSVWANPKELAAAVDRVPQLAKALKLDSQLLMRRITQSMDKEFLYLKRHLSPEQAQQVMALKLPGVNVLREYRRYYPSGEVSGHLVGFTSVDDDGQEGLELEFNHWLSGESGAKRVLKDRLGRAVENVESIRPPHHGRDLRTSIDLRLQYLAYRALKSAIRQHKAESGSIVLLDVQTGEVLAMVNQPTYNPNDRAQYSAERYRNRAITDIFEPGSSIKPLILAAALESGRYRPSSTVDTAPGFVVVGPKKIEDKNNLGRVSLTTVLSRSSNVGVTKVAMSLEPDQLWNTMTQFGLGALTSSGFPGESAGLLTHYNHWQEISQATLAYGYGVSVTPLQLAQAYAALGNDGEMRPVSLIALDKPNEGERILSSDTSAAIRRMMEEVVRPGGTGTKASIPGYRVAGKTGTTWKFAAGGYSHDKYLSIFAGLAPASDPRLAAVVIIDEPTGDLYYGSDVAAPVFADVISESLRLMAVPPDALPARRDDNIMQAMSQ